MPLISIIIPVYNIRNYLETCVDSLLNQNYDNMEIILVNDGSTDGSQLICKEYTKKYSQVKLINKPNGGLSDARNTGLTNATGEYIMFLDGDDFIQKNTLNSLENFILSTYSPDMVIFDYIKFYQQNNKYESVKKNISSESVSGSNGMDALVYLLKNEKKLDWMVWQGVYKKSLLKKNELFFEKGRLYEDVLWLPSVFAVAQSIEYFEQEIYVYRLEREGQITSTVTKKSLTDNIYVPVHWSEKLNKLEVSKETNDLLMNNFVIRYYYSIWFAGFMASHERQEIVEQLKRYNSLLKYSNGRITKLTRTFVKSIGFKNTSLLFKAAITLKRRIAN